MGSNQFGAALAIFFGIILGVLSWLLLGRAGLTTVMTLLGATVVGSVLSYLSWRNMALMVCIWLFAMSGFRKYAMIYMPFLPDVSMERILAIWIVVIFSLRLLMRRDHIRGPYALDLLLLMHTMYILANVTYIGSRPNTHEWAISSVTPFIAYMVGKNMMYRDRDVRYLFYFMLAVSVYYFTQSVAQKFGVDFLIWPKAILNHARGLWPMGRSRGPFLHPPLFGQMMGMFMMVQFYFFFRIKMRVARFLIAGCIALTALGLLFTYTRAPWLATAAGILTLAILRPRFRQLIAGIGVAVAVAAFIGALQFADSELLQHRVGDTNTIANRLAAMSAALRMWRDNPLFGIGFFNWDSVYGQYHRGEYIPLYGYVSRHEGLGVVIHDIYWGRLAEEGLLSIGLLLAASGIVWMRFKTLWRQVADSDWLNRDGLAVIAAIIVVYLVGGLGIDYRYFDLVNAVPLLFAGLLYGYEVPLHDPPPPPFRNWTPPYFLKKDDQAEPTITQV